MNTQESKNNFKGTWIRRIAWILTWIVLIITTLTVSTFFIFQTPYFQKIGKQYISNSVEKITNGQVYFNRLEVSFLDRINLDGFIFLDCYGDTILKVDVVSLKLEINPFQINRNGIIIKNVELDGAEINDYKYPVQSKSSLGLLIEDISVV
jgi:hypothetical protein